MAKNNKKAGDAPTTKLGVGELIEFEDIVYSECDTRFGAATLVAFADREGKIFRKCFAQGGMLKFLQLNPDAKSIVLKKKLVDGELTHNVWARG